jgi:formylmethanofuran dehydrogenase subunit C
MRPLSLTLRSSPYARIDMTPLTPDRLHGLGREAIARLRLQCGRRRVPVGDLFAIAGRDTDVVEIRRGTKQLYRVGYRMREGLLQISGHAGDNAGESMEAGEIRVRGDAGDWLGASMHGGRIIVQGNAGARVGGALAGQPGGMKDGLVQIEGSAGDRVGERMRGGTIVVLGDTGQFTGCRMAAGTIIVMGRPGLHLGLGMRRGTLVLGRRPRGVPAGFRSAGALKMEFLRLLFKQLGATHRKLAVFRNFGPEAIRMAGDLGVGGKGEILVLLIASQGQSP